MPLEGYVRHIIIARGIAEQHVLAQGREFLNCELICEQRTRHRGFMVSRGPAEALQHRRSGI